MIEIKNRWTGAVIYRSETAQTVRDAVIELAKKATESGTRADLSRADLTGADLTRAVLTGADLREIRDDVWRVLDAAPDEVPALLYAVHEGRINGSVYTGQCACLVGTIANVRKCSVYELPREIQPDATRTAERWFLGMRPGDAAEHHPVSRITAQWIEEWMMAHEVPVPRAMTFAQAAAFARANPDAFEAFASAGQ